jgi:dynein heavy chain
MVKSLSDFQKALRGVLVMSGELDAVGDAFATQRVPEMWEAQAYPSLKPLAAWVDELLARLDFIQKWIDNGSPATYWINGFYFPQAFLTGTLQNFARKHTLPIDTLTFDFRVLAVEAESLEKPEDGCYIYGLYLEGARWDPEAECLNESIPKQLFTELPVLHLQPVKDRQPPQDSVYRCPVYKVLSRRGQLSTTGHSTNFVMWIELPSGRETIINNVGLPDCGTWVKAGVAAVCALRY